MQVGKWGNSLAIRIPAVVAEALDLREGDEVEIRVAGDRTLEVGHGRTREQALERLRALKLTLPPGWKFRRDKANER